MKNGQDALARRSGWWGAFAGLIIAVLIAYPLSVTFALATHPASQRLLGGPLDDPSRAGYAAFWWLLTLLIAALPFVVGFGIAKLSTKGLRILASIVAIFVIAIVVLGQLFVF
ncbi:hypothetical protein [Conyzicola sp.]|uniref:hypothetical protein n=1 Tax=Conyzicola sp. TaxID=1969404 RepID=UPI003989E30C